MDRDFSFVFADARALESIAEALGNLRIAELTRFSPREIFRDPSQKGQTGHYSILIRVTFQALERTLRDEELQSYSQAVTAALTPSAASNARKTSTIFKMEEHAKTMRVRLFL